MNNTLQPAATIEPALLDYPKAQHYLGDIRRSKLKELAASRDRHVVRIGRRALFRREDLDFYIPQAEAGSTA